MTMHRDLITKLFRSFEDIAHREADIEYWLARELQELLGYAKWSNFEQVIDKARDACRNAGHAPEDHFADVGKMVFGGVAGVAACVARLVDDLLEVAPLGVAEQFLELARQPVLDVGLAVRDVFE